MLILNKPKWGLFAILYSNSGHSVIIFSLLFLLLYYAFLFFCCCLVFVFFLFFLPHIVFFSLFLLVLFIIIMFWCVCSISVTVPTRHEAYGSICKLLFKNMVKHRQGQTSVDRYVEGKTQEYSKSMRGSTIGEQCPKGLTIGVIRVHEQ